MEHSTSLSSLLLSLLAAKAPGPAEGAPAHHPHHQATHHEASTTPNSRQVHRVSHRVRRPAEAGAVPEMQGLHAGRVWHVPLLQGHEEVWRAWPHEAVLCPPAVLGGESKLDSWGVAGCFSMVQVVGEERRKAVPPCCGVSPGFLCSPGCLTRSRVHFAGRWIRMRTRKTLRRSSWSVVSAMRSFTLAVCR